MRFKPETVRETFWTFHDVFFIRKISILCQYVNQSKLSTVYMLLLCVNSIISSGFRGGEPAQSPPPHILATDWRRHSRNSWYVTTVLYYGDTIASVSLQTRKTLYSNIPNDCHQWLCDSFRVHQIRFRPGLRPRIPLWEQTLSWFKGAYFSGRGRK